MFCEILCRMRVFLVLAFSVVGAGILLPLSADDCSAERRLSVTVYNQDLGLVRDTRPVAFEGGMNEISFTDVASKLDPTSVLVRFPGSGPNVEVFSQNYRFDVAGTGRLLEIALDREVSVRTEGGELFRGTLIGYDNESLMVREESGAIVAVRREKTADVRFHELGGDLEVRPTLLWRMTSDGSGTREVEASYLTSGMMWHAEYAARLSSDEESMELLAWASIENRCGAAFEDAELTLVAGKVHRTAEIRRPRMEMTMAGAEAPPSFQEEEVFEYHSYSLDQPLTVSNNESVQLTLFPPSTVTFDKVYTYDPTRYSKGVRVTAETENTEAMGLGMPMPEGKIRVYSAERVGSRLVGEDAFKGTAVEAEIKLFLGLAFDIKGERERTAYNRLGSDLYEESYDLTLTNSKKEAVEVLVIEHPRGDWKITESNLSYEQKDSNTVRWRLRVPPSGDAKVSYTVQYRS